MFDFAAARRMMVDGQVRTADVNDSRLIAALTEVPREAFLPGHQAELAYLDRDLPVGEEGGRVRCLLKPMVLAKLIQAAEITETDRVLDVGCASGYSTAVLSRLCESVVGLEEDRGAGEDRRSGPGWHRRRQCAGRRRPAGGRLARGRPL